MKKKTMARWGVVMAALGAAMSGGALWWSQQDLLPEFVDAAEGPRAPTSQLFGFTVGETTFDQVAQATRARNLDCNDNSMRQVLGKLRAKLREGGAPAEGLPKDSMHRALFSRVKTKAERNPQVRWSCVGALLLGEDDVPSEAGRGRWLFVFDSPELPLRPASFRRAHDDGSVAVSDFETTVRLLTEKLGPPTSAVGTIVGGKLAKLEPVTRTWAFADLKVEVTALAKGERSFDVYHGVEVPWPVRADAPQRRTARAARAA